MEYQQEQQKAVINELCLQVTSLQAGVQLKPLLQAKEAAFLQLAALQDCHEQLSEDHEQLEKQHSQLKQDFAGAGDQLQEATKELVQARLDLETGSFLGQAGHFVLLTRRINNSHELPATLQELKVSSDEEISQLKQTICELEDASAHQCADSQSRIDQLKGQIAELREIIGSSMHSRRASTLKLETAMNALNLSKGDAVRFIQVHQLAAHSPPGLLRTISNLYVLHCM